jgi:hypothetical protein
VASDTANDDRGMKTKRTVHVARAVAAALASVAVATGGSLYYFTVMPGTSLSGPLPALTPAESAAAQELREHVTRLSVEIGERRAIEGDSLKRAESYLREELQKLTSTGAKLRREPLQNAPGEPANLVLDLPGKQTGPLVLLGAHYDTAPGGTRGANDNGSGTAAALVLAKRLASSEHALPIRIVLFANEEMPYFQTAAMGALQHAQGCRARGEELRAMFSLETMGYFSDEPGSQKYPAPLDRLYPDRGNFIAFVGNVGSRPLVRESIERFRRHATVPSEGGALPSVLPGVGWSDHWAFWENGYDAVMVTDTALFRDPTYHRASDIASNLDFDRLGRVVIGLQRVVEELAAP